MEKNHDLKGVFASSDEADDPLEKKCKNYSKRLSEKHRDGNTLFKYKGFWYYLPFLKPILGIERYFKPRDTDILLSSMPKLGTTWLKSLTYAIVNRNVHAPDEATRPLFTSNPHDLVPFLELVLYMGQRNPNLEGIPSPRIFATHLPYGALPNIVHECTCKIIYICRNPMDRFVSERHFTLENGYTNRDAKTLFIDDESLDEFDPGIIPFGPYWENALGYWNAHLKNPDKVLFLKYEDLKEDEEYHIKKIAEFIGFPFSPEEVENGSVEKISKLCSFDNLSEANKEGMINYIAVKKSSFFRKGEVGDWTNYLSKEMAQRMKDVMESKFEGSGLALDFTGL